MSECGLCVCHKKKLFVYMCVLVIFERDELYCKSQIKHCELQQSFAASNGENMVLHPNNILPKAHFLRYQPQIWNKTCLDLWL